MCSDILSMHEIETVSYECTLYTVTVLVFRKVYEPLLLCEIHGLAVSVPRDHWLGNSRRLTGNGVAGTQLQNAVSGRRR